MAVYKRVSGAWAAVTSLRKKVSGSMVAVTSLKVRQSGAWVEKMGMLLSISPNFIGVITPNASHTTISANVSVTGGGPSKTYSWSWVSNPGGLGILSPTGSGTSFTKSGMMLYQTYDGNARCSVSDGSQTITIDINVSITREI